MALTIGELVGYLRLDTTRFDSAMRRAQDSMSGAGQRMSRAGQQISGAGQTLTTRLTLPLAGVGLTAIKMAGDFEASMNGVRAVTGASGAEMDQMKELAKEMGRTTAFSASEAASAMEFFGMAGFKTNEIMEALPHTLNLAAAGNTDLARTADIASNIMSGFGIEASEMGRVADVLANAARNANVDLEMLGESLKYAAPIAQAAGWSFEETTAAVAMLGNAGIQGSMAGTGLNSVLATLADTSSTGGRKLAEFGVAATGANGKVRPLTEIMKDLQKKGAGVADVMSIFGLEAGPKLQALIGQGSEGLEKLIKDLENSTGVAQEMADIRMEGFNGELIRLKSAFQGLMIEIAEAGLLEWATKFLEVLTKFTSKAGETDSSMLSLASKIGIVAAVIGPLLLIIGKVVQFVGSAAQGLGMLARGMGTVATWTGKGLGVLGKGAAMLGRLGLTAMRVAGQMTLATARIVGSWALMGLKALLAAAKVALSWVIAFWPVALIVAAAAIAVALIIKYWDKIKKFFTDTLPKFLKKGFDFIVGLIKWAAKFGFFGPVGLIIAHWDRIKNFFTKTLPNAVSSGVKRAINWVKSLPGRVRSALAGAGRWLVGAGKDLLRGFWNGVNSMGGWLMGQIKGLVSRVVPGPVKKILGIASPSKLFAGYGENVAEGLALGMERTSGLVASAAGTLAAAAEGGAAGLTVPGGAARGGDGASAPPITVVLDVRGGDRQMRKMIREWVRVEGRGDVQVAFGQSRATTAARR